MIDHPELTGELIPKLEAALPVPAITQLDFDRRLPRRQAGCAAAPRTAG